MAFTRVQTKGANVASGTSVTATFASALTPGSLLVCYGIGRGTVTCSDPTNGSWTALVNEVSLFGTSSKNCRMFYKINQSASTAVTATLNYTTTGTGFMQVVEYTASGAVTYDTAVYSTIADNSTASLSISTPAPTQNGLWLFGVGCNAENASTYTASTGIDSIVGLANQANGSAELGLAEKLLTSGAHTGTITCSTGTGQDRGGIAIGFYQASSSSNAPAGTASPVAVSNKGTAGVGARAV